ncbi:MAG: heavy metal-responsive transcriptional regulator [Acidobacteriota bacterium]
MIRSLTRGQVSRKTGIGIEALRFYERKGLIQEPPRSDSGYRLYPASVIARLRFVRRAKELGFSLQEIKELLALRVAPTTTTAQVREQAQVKVADIQSKIRDLQKIKRALDKLVTACCGAGPASECPILEALEGEEEL